MATPLEGHPPVPIEQAPAVQLHQSTHQLDPSSSTVTNVAQAALTPPPIQPPVPAPLSSHTATNQTNLVKNLPQSLLDGGDADARQLQAIKENIASKRLKLGVIAGVTTLAVGLGAVCLFFGPVGWALGGCIIVGSLVYGGREMLQADREVFQAEGLEKDHYKHPGHLINLRLNALMDDYKNKDENFLEYMQKEFGSTPLLIMTSEKDQDKVNKAMNDFEIGISKKHRALAHSDDHEKFDKAIEQRLKDNRDIERRQAGL